jgi:hypothetical protein
MARRDLKSDLRDRGYELIETHISRVFLGADEVFKVKKPVSLGFLDFSTLEKRRRACEAEVELNRRLAPDVYLGVVPVTVGDDGRHRVGGDGEPVEWAVRMKRLPDRRRADHLLAAGELGDGAVERIAAHLAGFHRDARCDDETAHFGELDTIRKNVEENFEQTRDTIGDHLSPEEAAEIERWQKRFLADQAALFAGRVEAGRVRDGHGDLRLEHVYLRPEEKGGVTVVDCIEFNQRFRFADVCADVAFLAMDLTWQGRTDLAERFLAAYAREANDYDLYPLVDFYESYRAFVRAKVSSILAADPDAESEARERAAGEARRYYLLALASERRPLLPPAVVAVGGVIAAGKSTVARRIGAELSAPVIDADRTRKHLVGAAPTEPLHHRPFRGAYSEDTTEGVYAELIRRAGVVLASGRPVVLDASFRTRRHRRAAQTLARERGVPFHFVECLADPEICRRRLRRREGGVSDGRLEIFDDFLASWQPVEELPEDEHLVLDTAQPLEENVEKLRRELVTWPDGLTE